MTGADVGGTEHTVDIPATGTILPDGLLQVEQDRYADHVAWKDGGMGRITAAMDLRLGRRVAIKEPRVHSEELRARFEREARLTARLQHPSIVRVQDAGRWPSGRPFYVMELVQGRQLDQVLRTMPTFEERLALLPHVLAVADAMAYAHGQRIIHRDLKPQNVVIGEFGETVVVDWGLAKDLSSDEVAGNDEQPTTEPSETGSTSLTHYGEVLGTPAYMSPEQAEGRSAD